MRVKIILPFGSKLVKGNLIGCNEEGYDIVEVEGDEIIVDVGGEQYVSLAIENGVVTAWFPYKERESCYSCAQTFEKDSIIFTAYGLLFCSTDCVFNEFPDADLNAVETILASDIGVK